MTKGVMTKGEETQDAVTAAPARAIAGHVGEGRLARSAAGIADNPHPAGTLAAIEWRIGWHEAEAELSIETDEIIRDADLNVAHSEHRDLLRKLSGLLPEVAEVARVIGMPARTWPGNCHVVATALIQSGLLGSLEAHHGRARALYGVYTGPTHPKGYVAGRPMARHGWIELEHGLVVDPTRWAFEAKEPFLWVGGTADYDCGANSSRKTRAAAIAAFTGSGS